MALEKTIGQVKTSLFVNNADYTILDNDLVETVFFYPSGAERTIYLPLLANNAHRKLNFSLTGFTSFNGIIDGNGGQIQGQSFQYLKSVGAVLSLQARGTSAWQILEQNKPTYSISGGKVKVHGSDYEEGVWYTWSPVFTCTGSMTFTATAEQRKHFMVVGKTLFFSLGIGGTVGGTVSQGIQTTLPIHSVNAFIDSFATKINDAGNQFGGFTVSSATDKLETRKYDNSNFSLGASRYIFINGAYQIA